MPAMQYETFIRRAFSLNNRDLIGRSEDPASLANTDIYFSPYIADAKVGVGYAMAIFKHEIVNEHSDQLTEADHTALDNYLPRLLACPDLPCMTDIINEFIECYERRFLR